VNNEDALGEAIYRKKRNADDLSEDFGDLSARTRRGITKKRESGDFGDFSVRKKRGIAKKREAGGFEDFIARKPMACVVDFGDFIYRKKRTAMLESHETMDWSADQNFRLRSRSWHRISFGAGPDVWAASQGHGPGFRNDHPRFFLRSS